ncbi:MAG: VOC family protein [Chlamydiia bacterium]|nr:VOC family protein [Chlamydiia bacterium]
MTTTKTANPVVHFEIPVNDPEKAKAFYKIFNWEITEYPGMDYYGVQTTPVGENRMPLNPGAINGGLMTKTDHVKGPVIAIEVSSVDDFIEKVTQNGGALIMPKMEIPNMGYYAYIADPEGNILGLWEPMQ